MGGRPYQQCATSTRNHCEQQNWQIAKGRHQLSWLQLAAMCGIVFGNPPWIRAQQTPAPCGPLVRLQIPTAAMR